MTRKIYRRVNISIPEKLFERLAPFKSVLNVSGICATVLEREVLRLESALEGESDIDNMSLDQLKNLIKVLLVRQKAAE